MKRFYVGVKGIVQSERGILLLKSQKGYWDIPGGRMDGDESFEQTLTRELSEELPGISIQNIERLQGAYRLPSDVAEETGLILLYFVVKASVPEPVTLSDEHLDSLWVTSRTSIPEGLNPVIDEILGALIK